MNEYTNCGVSTLWNTAIQQQKRNVLILATTWMNLKGIKLSEGSQSQKLHGE